MFIDTEIPTIENCFDPPVFFLSSEENITSIKWEEPTVFDNSQKPVNVRILNFLPRCLRVKVSAVGLFSVLDHKKS